MIELFRLFILTYPKNPVSTDILVSKKFGTGNKLADLYDGYARFCVETPAEKTTSERAKWRDMERSKVDGPVASRGEQYLSLPE